ncbi:hypothetical protein KAFR_0A03970 [Kazachstania africana CBS 2517]|uniref:mRNA export factor MEX67 n=1 Tax=Kazachstania africana (strain ATCC 22294 / BCRC 22015 / CBS 2517 / CECT 1963 / NBRC 1671 / NRRL Y-8276) TaxID=1071382 RepID=H2AN82_KAZAF|nr:hypothetical protein KAFR_0A03970 [Kazachstania africana CBS 2517]CCF55832.1 hypothetical protein KAFR_0A03970 [Kazachstania africana CBS 2517]
MNNFHNVNNLNNLAQQKLQSNRVKISIRNWSNAPLQDLLNFISRNIRLTIMNVTTEGPLMVGYVNNMNDAKNLKRFDGSKFAGNNLKIEILDGDNNSTSSTVNLLKSFLYKRYDPNTKMLDLSNLQDDPALVSSGLFNSVSTKSRSFPAMMKIASKENAMIVESVNLAENNLRDLNFVSSLAQTYPKLKNLCLANNQINKLRAMEVWKNKFKHLRELLMINNPITQEKLYKSEMLNVFPRLVVLDNVVVRDEAKLTSIYNLPMQKQQFFFEDNSLGSSSTDFITNFLNLWDFNRSQLLGLYTPQSQFSVSIDSSLPTNSVKVSDQTPSFGYYLPNSRNITKISTPKLIQERLCQDQNQIMNAFNSLPKTKHELLENPSAYSMETVSLPLLNGFIITLHGYFAEIEKPELENKKPTSGKARRFNTGYSSNNNKKLSKKSFDRTWVIVPVGDSVVIASDLLTIRPYAFGSWEISGSAKTLQLPPEIQAKLNTEQLLLLEKLHSETKLTAEYTYMLAEQSKWEYNMAVATFQNNANNLPPNAFV